MAFLIVALAPVTIWLILFAGLGTRRGRAMLSAPFQARSSRRHIANMIVDLLSQPGWTWSGHAYGSMSHETGLQILSPGGMDPEFHVPGRGDVHLGPYWHWKVAQASRRWVQTEQAKKHMQADSEFASNVIRFAERLRGRP